MSTFLEYRAALGGMQDSLGIGASSPAISSMRHGGLPTVFPTLEAQRLIASSKKGVPATVSQYLALFVISKLTPDQCPGVGEMSDGWRC